MSTLTLLLVGILLYWMGVLALRSRGLLPDYVNLQGPLTSLHTGRGRDLLERLSRPKRFWRAWANLGLGLSLVVMALAFVFLLVSAVSQMRQEHATAVTQPRNVLVIPGVNQFLPLSVAPEIVIGLAVGLVVHEGGHGLLCRVEDIEIQSLGILLLAVVPLGAFVEPDEGSRRRANRGQQARMFAAGVTNNFAITVLAFALLFGPVAGSIAVAPGVHVGQTLPNSAAQAAGIEKGDRITAVAGQPVDSAGELEAVLANTSADTVRVEVNGRRTVELDRRLLVTGTVMGTKIGLQRKDVVVAVNGTNVSTRDELRRAVANRTFANVTTAAGENTTFPVGALVTVVPGEPLAAAGAPAQRELVVTRIAGERVTSRADLVAVMNGTAANETVTVEAYYDGDDENDALERHEYNVTLAEDPNSENGFLGVKVYPGFSGVTVNDFGIRTYPSKTFLQLLGGAGGGDASFVQRFLYVLVLPVAGVAPGSGISFNFAGFTGGVTNFYRPTGPLAFLGRWLFLLANLLFWTGWINFNLAFFNCIPGYPLDGGHILRNTAETVASRLPIEDRQRAVQTVTTSVGLTMLASLLLMLFGQGLLAG